MKAHTGTSKRTVVLFNMDDYALIKNEVTRRTEESGYPVTVADVLRDLVREKWKGNDDTTDTVSLTVEWVPDGKGGFRRHQTPGSRGAPQPHP